MCAFSSLSALTFLYSMYNSPADPGLCTKIFGVIKCIQVEGRWWLAADLSVECWKATHNRAMVPFSVFLILWVVGIPLFVAGLLIRSRKHLFNKNSPRHREIIHEFGSLYLQVSWNDYVGTLWPLGLYPVLVSCYLTFIHDYFSFNIMNYFFIY